MRLVVNKNRNGNRLWHCDSCCSKRGKEHHCEYVEELPVKENTSRWNLLEGRDVAQTVTAIYSRNRKVEQANEMDIQRHNSVSGNHSKSYNSNTWIYAGTEERAVNINNRQNNKFNSRGDRGMNKKEIVVTIMMWKIISLILFPIYIISNAIVSLVSFGKYFLKIRLFILLMVFLLSGCATLDGLSGGYRYCEKHDIVWHTHVGQYHKCKKESVARNSDGTAVSQDYRWEDKKSKDTEWKTVARHFLIQKGYRAN